MKGINAYKDVIILEKHFSDESFNFLENKSVEPYRNMKVSFRRSHEKQQYEIFEENHPTQPERIWLILANTANTRGKVPRIGFLNSKEALKIHKEWGKRVRDIEKTLISDLDSLKIYDYTTLKQMMNFNEKNSLPEILRKTISGKISLESLMILDSMADLFTKYDQKISKDDLGWEYFRLFWINYRVFFNKLEVEKIKKCLRGRFKLNG